MDLHLSWYDTSVADQECFLSDGRFGSDGRFAATPSDIFRSSVPSICSVVSSVSSGRLLMPALTLVTGHSVCDGAWVCSCISSKNSSNGESLTLALH